MFSYSLYQKNVPKHFFSNIKISSVLWAFLGYGDDADPTLAIFGFLNKYTDILDEKSHIGKSRLFIFGDT